MYSKINHHFYYELLKILFSISGRIAHFRLCFPVDSSYFICMMKKNQANKPCIIHVDMDAFYASVEILDNPELLGKPVIVGGTSDRSVVSAASYKAREFGIHSAMAIVKARKLCPTGIFLPVRMDRYREISRHIMDIFHRFTPLVEPISLDEAFLDVTGSINLFGFGPEIARKIKQLIKEETGLTASAGVATSKLIAKIASDMNKPDGLTIVEAGQENKFLSPLPINKLWGAGKKTIESLQELNVATIGDLAILPEKILTTRFGKHGQHLHFVANGIDDRPVVPARDAKSVGHEETFNEDLKDLTVIKRELLELATKVGERLRRYEWRGKTVTLKIKYYDFAVSTRSTTLSRPTCDTKEIYQRCCKLLQNTEAGRKPVRLVGISISNLSPSGGSFQQDLFGKNSELVKLDGLNKAVDEINRKFGTKTINRARLIKKG